MCQCIMCDCWWYNCYGVRAGWYHAHFCWSFWLCMPKEMRAIDPEECKVGCCLGMGYNHCWHGSVCCITDSLRTYSEAMNGSVEVVTVNTTRQMEPFNRGY